MFVKSAIFKNLISLCWQIYVLTATRATPPLCTIPETYVECTYRLHIVYALFPLAFPIEHYYNYRPGVKALIPHLNTTAQKSVATHYDNSFGGTYYHGVLMSKWLWSLLKWNWESSWITTQTTHPWRATLLSTTTLCLNGAASEARCRPQEDAHDAVVQIHPPSNQPKSTEK